MLSQIERDATTTWLHDNWSDELALSKNGFYGAGPADGLLDKVNDDKLARDVEDLSAIFEELEGGVVDFPLPCDEEEIATGAEVTGDWIGDLEKDAMNVDELSAVFDELAAGQTSEMAAADSAQSEYSTSEDEEEEYMDDSEVDGDDEAAQHAFRARSVPIVPAAPTWINSAPLDPRSVICTPVFKNLDSRIPRVSIPRMDLGFGRPVMTRPPTLASVPQSQMSISPKACREKSKPTEYQHDPKTCWICKSDKSAYKKYALHRYLEKRHRRNWKRGPRYTGRSNVATNRFLSKDKKDKVERFKSTTNAADQTAQSYLEMFNWDLMRAVDRFYADGGEGMIDSSQDDPSVSAEAIDGWFDQYADPEDEDTINDDGILKFCEDIGVDAQDIVVLVIAWKMEAAYMGVFTRKEWAKGMKALRCDSIEKLKAQIPNLRTMIESERSFKSFYSFCFGFSKEPGQKSLGIDIAMPMWELLLSSRFPKLTADWMAFLNEKKPCKGVTRDTWDLLLDFFGKVHESYDKYDENEAWPVLIDDYMSWIETNGKK
ncbi:hypothetical protein ATCC90586_004298 [Pythium insidiosum]|nr:hypothetical protein ATCC90586_004298 [Pythium insidiosum]